MRRERTEKRTALKRKLSEQKSKYLKNIVKSSNNTDYFPKQSSWQLFCSIGFAKLLNKNTSVANYLITKIST